MLLYISIAILFFIILIRINSPLNALLLVVASKSIIDATWNVRLGPISMISVEGILLPIIFFNTLLNRLIPKYWSNTGWLLFISLSTGIIFGFSERPVETLETFTKNINILLGFFLIPSLVNTKEDFRKLLLAIMIGGIFPIAISLYQSFTGVHWVERYTVGLLRYDGLYHDSVSVRFHCTITIIAALMYLFYFEVKNNLFKTLSYLLIALSLFSIYKVYSKAAVVIFVLWLLIWLLYSKRKGLFTVILGILVLVFSLIAGNEIVSSTERIFSKEIGFKEGEITDARYMLTGRGYIWDQYLDYWTNEQSGLFQLIGDGLNRSVHNEYLRVLLLSGMIGLLLYLLFLFRISYLAIWFPNRFTPFTLMLLTMYIVDTIGLTPGENYYYNILIWGLIGLFVYNQSFIEEDQCSNDNTAKMTRLNDEVNLQEGVC